MLRLYVGIVYDPRIIGHRNWTTLQNCARYQTYVQYLSIDNKFLSCDIDAGFCRERRRRSLRTAIKAGWPGKPETACNLAVSVGYRMAPSYRGPEKDLKCEPAEASLWQKAPSGVWARSVPVAAKGREHLAASRWQLAFVFLATVRLSASQTSRN